MELPGDRHVKNKETEKACENSSYATSFDSLSEMFDAGFKLYNSIDKTEKPTNSCEIQSTIRRITTIFENATELVSLANIFSNNECFEEVATENIKYFLLPALLGTLTTKISNCDNRLHNLSIAEIYFIDFLKRLKSYQLIDINIPKLEDNQNKKDEEESHRMSNTECISRMVNVRHAKIERYKYQQELEKKLEFLRKTLSDPKVDEESKREYFVTLLKLYANQAIDELSLIASEKSIVQHKQRIGTDSSLVNNDAGEQKEPSNNLKPVIITRDALQKKIYGVGYPSLPVLSVEEFYDQKVRDGEWPKQESLHMTKTLQGLGSSNIDECSKIDKEEEEKEEKVENDDPITLARTRIIDEYKDTHRRGWGNRYNRS